MPPRPRPPQPAPFVPVNADGPAPVVFLCDHASRFVPPRYRDLGLAPADLARHIAWDIGAADVTRALCAAFDAPGLLGGVSRLVIDLNRPLDDPTSIPVASDGTPVPGNATLAPAEAAARAERHFWPYHRAVAAAFDRLAARGCAPVAVFVHSFTPQMNGARRPWHVGVLWDGDGRIAQPLVAALRRVPGLVVGDNEPYSGADPKSYSLQAHGLGAGRPHVSIEFRQDLIGTPAGAAEWARLVGRVLRGVLADGGFLGGTLPRARPAAPAGGWQCGVPPLH